MKPLRAACAAAFASLAFACSSSSSSPPIVSSMDLHDAGVDASHHHASSSKNDTPDASMPDANSGGPDVHPDVQIILDPHDCVATSATSSGEGVGGYCSPGAGQCVHAGTGGTATLCTADFGAPAHEWFCTIPCTVTSDCGGGGGACLSAPFGQFCVPSSCANGLGDASSLVYDALINDAAEDAPDAETDSGAHDAEVKHDARAKHDAAEAHDASIHDDARHDSH